MRIFTVLIISIISAVSGYSQSFAPGADIPGTTAIHMDSSAFVGWASQIHVQRGYWDIADKSLGLASFGEPEWALGKAEGTSVDAVSLGDSGVAILQFDRPIANESGPDFAVFENGFANDYIELAFVEVSSDGINYQRFQAVSEMPTDTQTGPFAYSDCRYYNQLAGKYRQGYGTPFDLSELPAGLVDVNRITHIKIIDVIGTIAPEFASLDSQGNIINDPYPSAFEAGGFDLDAVGVIHQAALGIETNKMTYRIYPNPSADFVNMESNGPVSLKLTDLQGKLLIDLPEERSFQLDLRNLSAGMYLLEVNQSGNYTQTIISKL